MPSRLIAVAVLLTLVPAAWAQAPRAESAETDAAMERAKRAAAGPLKAIQQAAKITRRRGEGETGAPATVVVVSATATPVAASVAASAAAAAPVAPAPQQARPIEPPPAAQVLDVGARVPAAAEMAQVAPIAPAALAPAAATALPSPGAVTQPLLDTMPALPQVLEMVEPSIPPAVLAQGPRGAEVEAELSLRADGSVAGVTLLPPVPRAWQRHIIAALERWRYEPMAGPRTHRVRLVFTDPAER